MTHRRSGQSTSETRINVSRQAALVYAANYITLHSDLQHIDKKLKIAYGTLWNSRRFSWIRNGEDVGL